MYAQQRQGAVAGKASAGRQGLVQFLLFCVVGTIGFLVDTGVLYAALFVGLGPYAGRLVSYLAAVTVTWALNRSITFRAPSGRAAGGGRQWLAYAAANTLGFAVNYGTYALCLSLLPLAARHPVLGVAAGSVAGLVVNFTVNKYVVFRPASPPSRRP